MLAGAKVNPQAIKVLITKYVMWQRGSLGMLPPPDVMGGTVYVPHCMIGMSCC
jgi:hypothetical protein